MSSNSEERSIWYYLNAKDNASSVFDSFQSKLSQIVSAAALIKFGKDALFAADALEGVENRAKQIYGASFPRLVAETENLSNKLHRSSSDLLNMQANFGGVITGSGMAGRGVADMAGKLATLTVQFGNFFRMSDSDAFELMQGALLGQTRTLQRYGVVLNDATLQEYINQQGIKKKVNELSQSEVVLQRYNFLLENTKKIQAGGAASTDSLSSRVEELKGKWSDLLETVGQPTLPVAITVIDKVDASLKRVTADAIALTKVLANLYNSKVAQEKGATTAQIGDYTVIDYTKQSFKNSFGSLTTGTTLGPSPEQIQADILAQAAAAKEPYLTMGGGGGGGGGGGSKDKTDAEKMRDKAVAALTDMRVKYRETVDDVKRKLVDLEIEHQDKMADISKRINDVAESIKKLGVEYDKTISKISGQRMDTVVDQVTKIAELNEKLEAFKNSGDKGFMSDRMTTILANLPKGQDKLTTKDIWNLYGSNPNSNEIDIVNTALQRDKEQAALDAYLKNNQGVLDSQGYKDAMSRSKLTGFEKSLAGLDQQETDAKARYDEQMKQYKDQQDELEKSKKAEESLYTTRKKALNDTLIDLKKFMGTWISDWQNIDRVSDDILKNLNNKLSDLQKTISGIDALMQRRADVTGGSTLTAQVRGRFAGGTVGQGEYTVVGEDGPELARFPAGTQIFSNSQSKNMAAGMGDSGIVVQGPLVGSVQVNNKNDVDMLMNELGRQIRLIKLNSSKSLK